MSMLDHGEFDESTPEPNWCLTVAEELAISFSNYSESPTREKAEVLFLLMQRFRRDYRPPVVVEGVDE